MLLAAIANQAVSPFTPAALSGLRLRLETALPDSLYIDVAKTNPATSSGQTVLCWADKSGNGLDATPAATGNGPALAENSGGGKMALAFPGTGKLTLGNPSAINFTNASSYTIFVVFRPADTSGKVFVSKQPASGGGSNLLTSGINVSGHFERYTNFGSLDSYSTSGSNIAVYQYVPYYSSPWASTNSSQIASDATAEVSCLNSNIQYMRYLTAALAQNTSSPWGIGGWDGVGSYNFSGTMQAVLIYDRLLTQSEISLVNGYLAATYGVTVVQIPTSAHVVYDGNSITYGLGTSGADGPYPRKVYNLQTAGNKLQFCNLGIGGRTTSMMINDGVARVDSQLSTAFAKNILVAWEISNELIGGTSPADGYANYASYCLARRNAGWFVIPVTVLPRGNNSSFYTKRAAVNSLISANWADFASISPADVASDSTIGPDGAELNATYYSDQVNLTNAGSAIVAGIVKAKIDAALAA